MVSRTLIQFIFSLLDSLLGCLKPDAQSWRGYPPFAPATQPAGCHISGWPPILEQTKEFLFVRIIPESELQRSIFVMNLTSLVSANNDWATDIFIVGLGVFEAMDLGQHLQKGKFRINTFNFSSQLYMSLDSVIKFLNFSLWQYSISNRIENKNEFKCYFNA